ncbi:MAG: hypothetical protein A2Y40_00315 [Candidatus Margulisbacteria bacterium GWF2_35_9]|nr:MAG: hypothetical protein A2Y40_00315 [Candidatus Margulisbacteria bacterium GWF2_35_9]
MYFSISTNTFTHKELIQYNKKMLQLLYCLFVGSIITIIIFSYYLYKILKEKDFIYFIALLILLLFFFLDISSLGHQHLWGNFKWIGHNLKYFYYYSILYFLISIGKYSFLIKRRAPKVDKMFPYILKALPFIALLQMLFQHNILNIATILLISIVIINIFIGFIASKKRNKTTSVLIYSIVLIGIALILSVLGDMKITLDKNISTFIIMSIEFIASISFSYTYLSRIQNLMKKIAIAQTESIANEKLAISNLKRVIIAQSEALANEKVAIDNQKKANVFRNDFLSVTSHELRTPINGIIGLAESLLDGFAGNLSGKMNKTIEMIVKNGNRLSNLIDDILDYSSMKNKDIELQFVSIHLKEFCDIIISFFEPLSIKKGLLMINNINGDLPCVYADENRLYQIMQNLIGNSIKFTSKGSITLSANLTQSGMMEIHITDTGIGIPDDMHYQIFQSFEQVSDAVSREYGGTGLGLAITKELVEKHTGSINVKSQLGFGSTFTFTLPTTDKEAVPLSDLSSKNNLVVEENEVSSLQLSDINLSSDQHLGKTILVVDDEVVNLQVMINQLSLAGYNVETAVNGPETLARISKTNKPDLMILDIMMPKMSGFEVCSIIRETFGLFELPIIMVTAKQQVRDLVYGLQSGANDYINKPFNKHELLARVKNLLDLTDAIKTSKQLNAIKKELEIARSIQLDSLPQEMPQVEGLNIYARYFAMEEVGGDYYDFYQHGDSEINIIVADVTGHGLPAAIITSMFKIAYSVENRISKDPQSILTGINMTLYNQFKRKFITTTSILINAKKHRLTMASAGHLPTLIWRHREQELDIVETQSGMPIGFIENNNISKLETHIYTGDRIILYTDCIIEAKNVEGELFSPERFYEFVKNNISLTPDIFTDTLIYELSMWCGVAKPLESLFDDDFTIVVIDVI